LLPGGQEGLLGLGEDVPGLGKACFRLLGLLLDGVEGLLGFLELFLDGLGTLPGGRQVLLRLLEPLDRLVRLPADGLQLLPGLLFGLLELLDRLFRLAAEGRDLVPGLAQLEPGFLQGLLDRLELRAGLPGLFLNGLEVLIGLPDLAAYGAGVLPGFAEDVLGLCISSLACRACCRVASSCCRVSCSSWRASRAWTSVSRGSGRASGAAGASRAAAVCRLRPPRPPLAPPVFRAARAGLVAGSAFGSCFLGRRPRRPVFGASWGRAAGASAGAKASRSPGFGTGHAWSSSRVSRSW
jgi:hypothetical protein